MYVDQVQHGPITHLHHLLPRVLGALTLWAGELLSPGLSPYTGATWSCALGGALVTGLLFALVQRMTGSRWLPWLAATTAALAATPWRMSTTFEVHIFPVAAVLGCALVVHAALTSDHPVRLAAAAGALQGLAASLHLLVAPVALVWVVVLAASERRRAVRGQQLLAFLVGAGVALQAVYLVFRGQTPDLDAYTLLGAVLADLGQSPVSEPIPVTLDAIMRAVRLAWIEAGPWVRLLHPTSLAVALGMAGLGTALARPLWRRWRGMALAPLLWPLAVLPLTLVDAGNWEYWTGAVAAWAWLGALVLHEASERGPGWRRAAHMAGVALALWASALGVNNIPRGTSPLGEPVGVVYAGRGGTVILVDGRGGAWLWARGKPPLRLPGLPPQSSYPQPPMNP